MLRLFQNIGHHVVLHNEGEIDGHFHTLALVSSDSTVDTLRPYTGILAQGVKAEWNFIGPPNEIILDVDRPNKYCQRYPEIALKESQRPHDRESGYLLAPGDCLVAHDGEVVSLFQYRGMHHPISSMKSPMVYPTPGGLLYVRFYRTEGSSLEIDTLNEFKGDHIGREEFNDNELYKFEAQLHRTPTL